jgi:GNAT superfamily N-acetyltransferase
MRAPVVITPATEDDLPLILQFIEGLADYERLRHECVASIEKLRVTLFTSPAAAEVVIARIDGKPVGFALFFHSYSTFLAQRGLFLEDLFVNPDNRGLGVGKALLSHLAKIALERNCGRFEWNVLDWNELAINFYRSIGAVPMDEWTTFRVTGDALNRLASAT